MDFKPTDEQRHAISVVAGSGVTHEEIALGLGISVSQLKEHFAEELTRGAYARRQEVIEATYKAALKGSSAAAKAYLRMDPKPAAPPLPKVKKQAEPGKKEQANADAKTAQAGTEWENLLKRPPQGQAN